MRIRTFQAPRPQPSSAKANGSSPNAAIQQTSQMRIETFNGERFQEEHLVHSGHAVDIIELWNRSWFGSLSPTPLPSEASDASGSPRERGILHSRRSRERLVPQQQQSDQLAVLFHGTPHSTTPPVMVTPERSQAEILQELPGIGTWAGRQRLFAVKPLSSTQHLQPQQQQPELKEPSPSPQTEAEIDEFLEENGGLEGFDDAGPAVIGNPGGQVHGGSHLQLTPSASNASSESRHMHEAWCWRFSRKWEAEQRRAPEENDGQNEEDDLSPLEYMQACGLGLDLQVSKPAAHRPRLPKNGRSGGGANGPGVSPLQAHAAAQAALLGGSLLRETSSVSTIQFEVEPSFESYASYLLADAAGSGSCSLQGRGLLSNADGAGPSTPSAAATRDLLRTAVRGQELLQRQREIENEASARWERIERVSGGAGEWVGTRFAAADVDMSGKFFYVVLKLAETAGGGGGASGSGGVSSSGAGGSRQKLLVRGRRGAIPQELLEETVAAADDFCEKFSLPRVVVSIVGSGILEWREDTDRHLHLLPAGSGSPPQRGEAPSNVGLAACILRQSLPCHFKVVTRSEGFAPNTNER